MRVCSDELKNDPQTMSNENAQPILTVTDAPGSKAEEVIEGGLAQFNEDNAGYRDLRRLAVLVSDPETKVVVGGLLGRTSLGLLSINRLFLPASLRKRGLGGRIMQEAEDEARRRGCGKAVVTTINFQAPKFYERHGYQVFGQIECLPGVARIYLSKKLV
jgi:GNAT superfamily N-acetyltransferase